jgi:hypothetical protein
MVLRAAMQTKLSLSLVGKNAENGRHAYSLNFADTV